MSTPSDASPGPNAIESLATLPVFLALRGRVAVVAGGGAAAAWKAQLLLAAGATTLAFCERPCAELIALAGREGLQLVERDWTPADFEGAAVAILESVDAAEAESFKAAARAAGALVNVVDNPLISDFSFGSIVNRSPLIVAISTGGAAPVFGQAIRARLETLLPAALRAWAAAAQTWRARLAPLGLSFAQRRRFWEHFAQLALAAGGRAPQPDDFDRLASAERSSTAPAAGEITLIGAGPGDPELLTLKAIAALQRADVILYDKLVSPRALELARREARRVDVGKRAGLPSANQAEITNMLVSLARAGNNVVRLKGGDPGVFSRANEEIAAARAAGVEITLIPGITTALAAAAQLGMSLSDRDRAMRIQFATAHDRDGELASRISWAALASNDATTVVYMGAKKLDSFVNQLLEEGLDPATPAAFLENVSLPTSLSVLAPIAELPARAAEVRTDGPALLIYGQAVAAGRIS